MFFFCGPWAPVSRGEGPAPRGAALGVQRLEGRAFTHRVVVDGGLDGVGQAGRVDGGLDGVGEAAGGLEVEVHAHLTGLDQDQSDPVVAHEGDGVGPVGAQPADLDGGVDVGVGVGVGV